MVMASGRSTPLCFSGPVENPRIRERVYKPTPSFQRRSLWPCRRTSDPPFAHQPDGEPSNLEASTCRRHAAHRAVWT
eukprot:5039039-Pyramimonas_sp.AAC.1